MEQVVHFEAMKATVQSERPRPSLLRRESALLLLFLAAAVLAVMYVWLQQQNPAADHLQAGRNYMRMNMGSAAEREWKEATRRDPNSAAAWELLAGYYANNDDYDAAIEPLRQLARLQPDNPKILNHLASCASRASDPVRILGEAEAAMKRDPNDVGALAIAVKLLAKSDEEQKRLDYLRRMVALRPHDVGYMVQLARTLTNAHLFDEAAPLIEGILKLDSGSVDAYGLRGRKRLDTGTSQQDLTLAEADFQKALALNPRGPMIHLQLGKLYLRRGQADLAVTHLETAARLLPDQPEVFFVLGAAYTEARLLGKSASARKQFAALRQQEDRMSVLEKRCAADPANFDDHLQAGLVAVNKGEFEKADYFLNRAQILHPGDSRCKAALKQLAALTGEGQSSVTDGQQ